FVDPCRLATLMRVRLEIIENAHAPSFFDEQVSHVGSDQPRAACDQRAFSVLVHWGQILLRPSPPTSFWRNFVVAGAIPPSRSSNSSHKRRRPARSSTSKKFGSRWTSRPIV